MRKHVLVTAIEPSINTAGQSVPRMKQCDWAYCNNEARFKVRAVDQYAKWEKSRGAAIV